MKRLKLLALIGLASMLSTGCPSGGDDPDLNNAASDVGDDASGGADGGDDANGGDDVGGDDVGGDDVGDDVGGDDVGGDAGDDVGDEDTGTDPTAVCGDGLIEGDEECDDKNTDDSDGCSSTCVIESGWGCSNAINLNTGSDGAGGQLGLGDQDSIWTWAQGTLDADGMTPDTLPSGLTWNPTTAISKCAGAWHDATAPAQWINTTGWDANTNSCSPHPQPLEESLRYYRTTFDLPNADAAAVTTLSGKMWADNQATRIFINGVEVTEYQPPAGNGSSFVTADAVDFGTWGSDYYQAGENEIVIAVKNLASPSPPNPEGLLVRVPSAFETGSVCTKLPVCGDGIIEGNEECDDRNTDDTDGCSSTCEIETGFACSNSVNLNTGSDGQGGQLSLGSTDSIWTWAQGTLNADGSTPSTQPSGLTWNPTTVIRECVGTWHDATAPAQWINTTGWDANSNSCSPHPQPLDESLRYYRATFNIPNADAAAATTLSGKMWADNQATRIFINGVEVTEYQPPASNGSSFMTGDAVDFGSWGSNYYQAGENEIVIAVKNLASPSPPNPEGLLVHVPDAFTTGSVCTRVSTCGDGVIEGNEECDDANTDDADGCSSTCNIETGWGCANAINLNTGSDGQGGQLSLGSTDPIWTWAQGTLNADGSTPSTQPSGLTWNPTTVISECFGTWHDATAPAQWINSTGWDSNTNSCSLHPEPLDESLRYYRTTFNIPNANAAAATTLSGKMWADNQVTRIFINGVEVTEHQPPASDGSSFMTADAVDFGSWGSNYYQAGVNEIVIAVKNLSSLAPPNPEGLLIRVPNAFQVGSMCTQL